MTTILGNTYPVKDILKSRFKARWNDKLKGWDVADQFAAEANKIVGNVFTIAPKVSLVTEVETNWSGEQQNIFEWFKSGTGHLLVRARAGTGKTTTIKHAFTFAPEAQMLYAVFNKKNQREASEKITDTRVDVKTLHAVGFRAISEVWRNSKPDDNVEFDRIKELCGDSLPDDVIGAMVKLVGFTKNLTINPTLDDVIDIADERDIECEGFEGEWPVSRLAEVTLAVLELSRARDSQSRISFNDMVWLPVAMKWVRPHYDLVCVDECQDMNLPQLEMAKMSVKDGGRICVVGDDRQAIYGFRGAQSNGLDLMKQELCAKEMSLTITYRCPSLVVALANEYVPDYVAAPGCQAGIVDYICENDFTSQVKVGDVMLSRVNAPLMILCLSLLRKGIPARIEGRDIGKLLIGLVRKMKAKSVPDFLKRVENWEAKQIKRTVGRKNAEGKIALIQDQSQTLIAIAEGLSSVAEIETRINSLFEDSERTTKPAVIFSSVHKAKGLEFDRVFILRNTFLRKGRVSREEENIYYVAITRSKRHLIFVTEQKHSTTEQTTKTI